MSTPAPLAILCFLDGFKISGFLLSSNVIEEIGTYDPNCEPSAISVNEEAAKKWLNTGAQPTETVSKIFKAAGIEK